MTVRSARLFALAFAMTVSTAGMPVAAQRGGAVPQLLDQDGLPILFTKLEVLLHKPGVLLVKDLYRIETRMTSGVTLDAIVVTEYGNQTDRLRGLRIELRDTLGKVGSSYVDYEEASALSQSLAAMTELTSRFSGKDDQRSSDLRFASAGGFVASVHQSIRVQIATLTAGVVEPVTRTIEIADFTSLKSVVDRALALLAEK